MTHPIRIYERKHYYELHKIIKEFLDYKVYKIIVDLSDLKYMTSFGAGVFINAGFVTQEHQGALVLINPQPQVKTILDFIGLTEICRLVNDLDDALAVFGKLEWKSEGGEKRR